MKTKMKTKRILLADPRLSQIEALKNNLELVGNFEVKVTSSLEDVLNTQKEFDIIVLGISFSYDSCRHILNLDERVFEFLGVPFPFFNLITKVTTPYLIYSAYNSALINSAMNRMKIENSVILLKPLWVRDLINEINQKIGN